MKNIRIEGIATALSSISHGEGKAGTVTLFRREKMWTPGGVKQVPTISGNSFRGLLRDECATVFWEALGKPQSTVQYWSRTGTIPVKWQSLVQEAARLQGIEIAPSDFLPTADAR